jgi:hypothetical protein
MTVKLMINTRTQMVSVFDERVIEERPWYVAYEEGAPIPADPTAEPQVQAEEAPAEEETADKPKRKSWKDAVAEKAKELEAEPSAEEPAAEAAPEAGSAE